MDLKQRLAQLCRALRQTFSGTIACRAKARETYGFANPGLKAGVSCDRFDACATQVRTKTGLLPVYFGFLRNREPIQKIASSLCCAARLAMTTPFDI
jgi:hypothetical protein